MSHNSHTYILIQVVSDPTSYQFESPVSASLKSKMNEKDVLFTVDNYSDSISLSYIAELLKASSVTIVCDIQSEKNLGKIASILNQALRHPNLKLFVNVEVPQLKPFMVQLAGSVFHDVDEIFI